jgi:hypothetical protein
LSAAAGHVFSRRLKPSFPSAHYRLGAKWLRRLGRGESGRPSRHAKAAGVIFLYAKFKNYAQSKLPYWVGICCAFDPNSVRGKRRSCVQI